VRLAANLDWMYRPMREELRFAAAQRDGWHAVEALQPYAQPPEWYARQLRAHALSLVLINTPVEAGAGRLGVAALPGAEALFKVGFDRARAVAQATGCRRIHVMAGAVDGIDPAAWRATLLRNLDHALEHARRDQITLTLEALNRTDMPGYAYHLPSQVIEILAAVACAQLRLQFDGYHVVKEGLDPVREVHAAASWIGHVQIAGAPDRHEPNLRQGSLLQALLALPNLGYDSWLGCEYAPAAGVVEGLSWSAPLRERGILQ